jgi:hypothetical protein
MTSSRSAMRTMAEKQNRWLIVLSKGGCLKGNASNSDRARPIFSLIYSNWIETDR